MNSFFRFFVDNPQDYNNWRWIWSGPWSQTSLLLLGLLLALAVFLSWRPSMRLPTLRQKLTLLGLRCTGAAFLWLLLASPSLEFRHIQKIKNFLPIFVDTSASMRIRTGSNQPTRLQQLKSFFKRNKEWLARLQAEHKVRLYSFDRNIKVLNGDFSKLEANGDQTNLLRVGQFLQERFADRPLAGAILVTDGIDTLARSQTSTSSITKRTSNRQEKKVTSQRIKDMVSLLQQTQVPVHVIAPKPQKALRDIAVSDIYGDAFAFLHNKATLEVRIRAIGFPGLQVPVSLYREGQLLQTKMLRFRSKRTNSILSFQFRPSKAGQFIYSVRVPLQVGETLAHNNKKSFILKILRDRIRVLQLTGRPSWDVRFLRRLLKKNASVDLISFFILRTLHNVQPVPQREMALIPFPAHQLFTKRLNSFDLVIFQNFNYGPYLHRAYLQRIEQFVRKGGAFMILGGDLSFGKGGYLGTAVESILPLKLNLGQIDTKPFRPGLTAAGKHHPITQLLADPKANREMWKNFPKLQGTNLVGDVKAHGTALLEHPTARTPSGRPVPILSVGHYGKGRVLSLTVDDSWRWNFQQVGKGGTQAPYYRFWNNAIRWLIRDPELERIRISSFRSSYRWGESARFRIRVFNRDYRPQRKGKVKVTIQEAPKGKVLHKSVLEVQTDGSLHHTWEPRKPGKYKIRVESVVSGPNPIVGESLFEVRGLHDEYLQIQPNERFFKRVTTQTKSRLLRMNERVSSLPFRPPTILRVNRSQTVPLWDNLYVLLFLIGVFGVEWFIRRRWGLP